MYTALVADEYDINTAARTVHFNVLHVADAIMLQTGQPNLTIALKCFTNTMQYEFLPNTLRKN